MIWTILRYSIFMEYRSIVFQTMGYKFIFVMFCKKAKKKFRATVQHILANRSLKIFILVSGSRLAKGWEPLF